MSIESQREESGRAGEGGRERLEESL